MYVDSFWLFIILVVLAGVVSTAVRNYQREKTIRTAIDKGVQLDPAMLSQLQRRQGDPRTGLFTGGIVTFFVGCGLAAMGYVLDMGGAGHGHTFTAMLAVGALLWCISAGLFVAGLFTRRSGS